MRNEIPAVHPLRLPLLLSQREASRHDATNPVQWPDLFAKASTSMQALPTAIVTWLSINFALPATSELPTVRFTSPIEIAFLHHQAITPEARKRIVDA